MFNYIKKRRLFLSRHYNKSFLGWRAAFAAGYELVDSGSCRHQALNGARWNINVA
jgi:hypothetical protein